MIVSCPKCGKKYSISDDKIGDTPRRLRCRSCSEVFSVSAPPKEPPREPAEEDSVTRARRLARVLASDMVVYNKDLVEKARRDGSLPEVMSAEIERSWQLWKSRFPDEGLNRLDVFRNALNDILAGGMSAFDDWTPESR